MTRIVQVANFVAPHSGGIRTVLEHLARGYAECGHEVVQIVPGRRAGSETTAWGTRVVLHGVVVPSTGYRVLLPATALRAVRRHRPGRLEVHDRATLTSLGRWAEGTGVASIMVAHERLDRLIEQWLPRWPGLATRTADRSNYALTASFARIVCTTAWAAEELRRSGRAGIRIVPLGVDTELFRPAADGAPDAVTRLVMVSRLSPEKSPGLAVDAVRELVQRGVPVRLTIAGDGPLSRRLQRAAAGLPVHFAGHLPDRAAVAALLASSDVALAPGPVETFGLAALEALACGTPVVANARSALPGVLATAGLGAAPYAPAFADAVESLLSRPAVDRRVRARWRAEQFSWSDTVAGFLAAHDLPVGRPVARAVRGDR